MGLGGWPTIGVRGPHSEGLHRQNVGKADRAHTHTHARGGSQSRRVAAQGGLRVLVLGEAGYPGNNNKLRAGGEFGLGSRRRAGGGGGGSWVEGWAERWLSARRALTGRSHQRARVDQTAAPWPATATRAHWRRAAGERRAARCAGCAGQRPLTAAFQALCGGGPVEISRRRHRSTRACEAAQCAAMACKQGQAMHECRALQCRGRQQTSMQVSTQHGATVQRLGRRLPPRLPPALQGRAAWVRGVDLRARHTRVLCATHSPLAPCRAPLTPGPSLSHASAPARQVLALAAHASSQACAQQYKIPDERPRWMPTHRPSLLPSCPIHLSPARLSHPATT